MNRSITSKSDYAFSNSNPGFLHPFFEKTIQAWLNIETRPRVADVGCGNGSLCRFLKDEGFDVYGVEPGRQGFQMACESHPDIRFYHLGVDDDGRDLPRVDAVVTTEVVEHLFLPRALPRFCKQIIEPGGTVLVSTPYHGWLKNTLIAASGMWDNHHNPLWDYGHVKFWSRATLTRLFEEQGFVCEGFRGHGRIPGLWKTMMLMFRAP